MKVNKMHCIDDTKEAQMKFKVGQKVRMVRNVDMVKVGDTGIIRALPCSSSYDSYVVEFPCLAGTDRGHTCEGLVPSGNGHWIYEKRMELASEKEGIMNLESKLNLFKAGTHVLHTPTQEIYDKLMVELEKRGYKWGSTDKPTVFNAYCGDITCISYEPYMEIRCCSVNSYEKTEVIELTLEDFKGSEQEEHMKIKIETDGYHKTTAECNGITAESLCNPMDAFKLTKGVHMAVQRLLEKLEEDTKFHVGDIVEVLGTDTPFIRESVGLQGKVKGYDKGDGMWLITLPIDFAGINNWWYRKSDLKLVRRGNK